MRLLLDTHALVWWVRNDDGLSKPASQAIASAKSEVFVSVVVAWEIAIKVGLGKWPEARELLDEFESTMTTNSFKLLPITIGHARVAGLMQTQHRDPFDRLLVAQAQIEGLSLVTADGQLADLGASILW